MRTRKVKAAGRFRAGYGLNAKKKLVAVENKQHKKQTCPFCKKPGVKREEKGVWKCRKCGKRFASDTFFVNK